MTKRSAWVSSATIKKVDMKLSEYDGSAHLSMHSKCLLIAAMFLLPLFCGSFSANAQAPKYIRIETKDNLLLLSVTGSNKLQQLSYGNKISGSDLPAMPLTDNSQAYPDFGVNVSSAAFRITHDDGNTTSDLVYSAHTIARLDSNSVLTTISLKDSYYPVEVNLCYKTFAAENMIQQWVEVRHREKGSVVLYDVSSSSISFNEASYYLTYFNGDWANEFNMYESSLQPGIFTLDSKEGVRTAQKTSPSFLLSLNKKLEEENGNVMGASLAWPGNWQIQFNVDQMNRLKVAAGINPYAANYLLPAGQVFKTPPFIYTFSNKGAGEVTRRFHRWARKYGMNDGNGDRDVVLNNWETTGMDFNEEKLSALIRQAGDLGFDLFLLDDGWFGNKFSRNTDQAGLGDWEVNHQKLPHGLGYLEQQGRQHNVKFGLWVEPEMVNPKSELYAKHPGWALSAPHRPLDEQRNQLILDLANPEVQDYIVATLDKLISENKGIAYLKWDCNRFLTNAWSNYLGRNKQPNLYVDYARGFLNVLERFRKKYPDINMMLCASGGGRMDYGSMQYFNEYWPSDNSNAHDRVRIQWGMNYFFPSIGFAGHVSEMGRKTSLKFRFDVAMAGKLGMDMQPAHLNDEERKFAINAIKTYKQIKNIVFYGDLYRLLSPYTSNRTALMYVSEDKKDALVFSYQLQKGNGGDFTRILLKGLKPDAKYLLTEINKTNYSRLDEYEGKVFSGAYLMEQGLRFAMWDIDESNIIQLKQQ